MPEIKSKKQPIKPRRHTSESGYVQEYDLREVDTDSLVAELIRRGWRGFGRPEQQGMVLPKSKVSSSRGGKH